MPAVPNLLPKLAMKVRTAVEHAAKLESLPHVTEVGGQKDIGAWQEWRVSECKRVLKIQENLNRLHTLKNLSKAKKREVWSPEGNSEKMVPDLKFMEAMDHLDAIIDKGHNAALVREFSGHATQAFYALLRKLKEDLTVGVNNDTWKRVQVWESDPCSLKFCSLSTEKQFHSVFHHDDIHGVLHVYCSRALPNLLEAILYAYLRHSGYNHLQAIVGEAIAAKRKRAAGDNSSTVSDRIYKQLANAPYRDLLLMLQYTKAALVRVHQSPKLTADQKKLLIRMTSEVNAIARHRLVVDIDTHAARLSANLELLRSFAPPFVPIGWESFEADLLAFLRRCCWQNADFAAMRTVFLCWKHFARVAGFFGVAAQRTQHVLLIEGRRLGLEELTTLIRDSNPFPARDVDLMTVYLEFNGKGEVTIQRIFGMSKYEIAPVIYERLRDELLVENPPVEQLAPKEGAYDRTADELLSWKFYFKKFGDGLFWVAPLLINLILVLTIGVGVYTSTFMTAEYLRAYSLAMFFSFMLIGGSANAIARVGSLYTFQWSFGLVMVILNRVLVGSILIVLLCSCAVAYAVTPHPAVMFHFIGYTFLFSYSLLMISCLYNMHLKSIWKSAQGICVIVAELLQAAVVYAGFYSFNLRNHPNNAHWVHLAGLVVCDLVLSYGYLTMAHSRTYFLKRIKGNTTADVVKWYSERIGQPPPPTPTADAKKYDKELGEWFAKRFPETEGKATGFAQKKCEHRAHRNRTSHSSTHTPNIDATRHDTPHNTHTRTHTDSHN